MLDCDIEFSELKSEEVDTLTGIALSLNEGMVGADETLKNYETQIQYIYRLIELNNCTVLSGLLAILLDGLETLIKQNKSLTIDDCEFLKKIPGILSEYALIPSSKMPDVHFLNHFKNTSWIRPVTEEEGTTFLQFIMEGSVAHEAEEELQKPEELLDKNSNDEIELSDLLTAHIAEVDDSEASVAEIIPLTENGSNELEIALSDLLVTADTELGYVEEDTSEIILLSKDTLNKDEKDGDEDEFIDLAELSRVGDVDDPIELYESKASDFLERIEDTTKSPDESAFQAKSDNAFPVSDDQKEWIDLVINELEEIAGENKLNIVDDSPELKNHLINIAEQLDNISNAIDLIGLEGLEKVCRCLSSNIHMLALSETDLSDKQKRLIEAWPLRLLSYLNDIAGTEVSNNLIAYLKDLAWPESISDESIPDLKTLLKEPQFFTEDKKIRQDIADPGDMSLELPEDVNPDLLEGLLQDLPVQSQEFSTAIQNLNNENNLEHLEVAQRIAHTLKGAGNVVGVKGIANLTHHLEDILEIQSKANKLPSKLLLVVLIDAADCLETMSEALLGIDEPPDNGLSVFQSVLDWANKLDIEGATDFYDDNVGDHKQSLLQAPLADEAFAGALSEDQDIEKTIQVLQDVENSPKKPISIENMLRVPASLADDLLRLAGENMISTSQIQEYIKTIQKRYDTLKAHNQSLQQLSFDLERVVDVQGIADHNNIQQAVGYDITSNIVAMSNDFDSLELDQYHELHSMSRKLVEIAADSIELANVMEKDIIQLNGLVLTQNRLQKENENLVLKTRMVPTKTIAPRLKRGVKQACRLTGKDTDIELLDNDTYMDSEILNGLIEPLMHLLRNAVDHGIESAEERIQANKNSRGLIKLIFSRKGNQIAIDIEDDGKGLSLVKIREKAIAMGLASSEHEITETNLKKFILHPGFTTRTEVSHVSGRGIGLDVVHNKIRELKGSIEISSVEGQGCRFSLTLPISSFSVHSLLVRIKAAVYAFSNRGIEEILHPGMGEFENIGDEVVFKLNDQVYNTAMIEPLLNIHDDRRSTDRGYRPVILVKDDTGSTTAVRVQDVLDSKDVVVKSMGAYIPKVRGVIGATVLGDGSIAPVIDLPELVQAAKIAGDQISHKTHVGGIEVEAAAPRPYILVVDDSLSARKSLAQFVQDLGFEVRTAGDGLEAVTLVDACKPGLVLVDMEMPRMNGLELTGYIRSREGLRDTPVVMISSRATDKHRKVAMDKGVDHYMLKPFAEDELASYINTVLKVI